LVSIVSIVGLYLAKGINTRVTAFTNRQKGTKDNHKLFTSRPVPVIVKA